MKKEQSQINWKILSLVLSALLIVSWMFFGIIYSNDSVRFSDLENPQTNLQLTETDSNGVKLISRAISEEQYEEYDISPRAVGAFTVTATVYDVNGYVLDWYQNVEFSIRYLPSENPSYVEQCFTLEQEGTTATITCLQSFIAPFALDCVCVANPDVKASLQIDFNKRVESIDIYGFSSETAVEGGEVVDFDMPSYSQGYDGASWYMRRVYPYYGANFGDGTVGGEILSVSCTISVTEVFKQSLSETDSVFADLIFEEISGMADVQSGSFPLSPTPRELFEGVGFSSLNDSARLQALYSAILNCSEVFNVTVQVSYSNGGESVFDYGINCVMEDFGPASIEFDSENHII